uniref:LTD domain-containing protein n=1 Tax=Echinostoma caproni TaxID=27848 RepID=A0A183B6W2_9TREM
LQTDHYSTAKQSSLDNPIANSESSACPYPVNRDNLLLDPNRLDGPNLIIQDVAFSWQIKQVEPAAKPCDIHIVFECNDPEKQTKYLRLFNNGTALLHYEWTRVKEPDTFGLDRSGHCRFFLDFQPGTLQPGEIIHIPITFRSWREEIYCESWRLDTKPVLNGGQPIRIRLRGLSIWPKSYQFHALRPNAPNTEVFFNVNQHAFS